MQRQILFFAYILLMLIVLAFITLKDSTSEKNAANQSLLDSNLFSTSLTRITIRDAQQYILIAELIDSEWQATHLSQTPYPLNKVKLSELIRSLQKANKLEAKSANNEAHSQLGLSDLNDENSSAKKITLQSVSGTTSLLIGKRATNQQGHFVRYENDDQMWLIDQSLTMPKQKFDWLKEEVLPFSQNDLKSIRFVKGNQFFTLENLNLSSEQNPEIWALNAFNADTEELRYPQILADYVNDLLTISYSSLEPFDEATWLALEKVAVFEIMNNQKVIYLIELKKQQESYLLHLQISGEHNWKKHWLYNIPKYQIERLIKSRSEFLSAQS